MKCSAAACESKSRAPSRLLAKVTDAVEESMFAKEMTHCENSCFPGYLELLDPCHHGALCGRGANIGKGRGRLRELVLSSGRGGIRTPGELSPTPVFKTGALNHSATRPDLISRRKSLP